MNTECTRNCTSPCLPPLPRVFKIKKNLKKFFLRIKITVRKSIKKISIYNNAALIYKTSITRGHLVSLKLYILVPVAGLQCVYNINYSDKNNGQKNSNKNLNLSVC